MRSHTPGPWVVMTRADEDGFLNYDHEGGVVAQADLEAAEDERPYPICVPELAADACLIAAAPDLLALLQWMLNHHDHHGYVEAVGDEDELYLRIKAVIAKATGQD
jgi:GH15 family glucan-1,4-alpha-glucosidase